MSPRTRLALAVATSLAVVLVAAVAAYAVLSPRQSAEVAVPAADASPEQVVTAYLEALHAHDCETADTLSVPGFDEVARDWCEDVAALTDREVREPVREDPAPYGGGDREVVYVPVRFDLDWRWGHDDISLPEGAHDWGYLLERRGASQPWRIFDEGMG